MKTPSTQPAPRSARRLGLPVAIAAASILLAACAGTPAPNKELALSDAAVTRAANAGGGELAPVEMRTAREKLDRAKRAMAAGDYDDARVLAQQAQVDAQLAEAKARSSVARKAADELKESVRVLREELDRKNP